MSHFKLCKEWESLFTFKNYDWQLLVFRAGLGGNIPLLKLVIIHCRNVIEGFYMKQYRIRNDITTLTQPPVLGDELPAGDNWDDIDDDEEPLMVKIVKAGPGDATRHRTSRAGPAARWSRGRALSCREPAIQLNLTFDWDCWYLSWQQQPMPHSWWPVVELLTAQTQIRPGPGTNTIRLSSRMCYGAYMG